MFFLKFCHFFRAKLVQKVKNYVFHLNYYETEKMKKTKPVWHKILQYDYFAKESSAAPFKTFKLKEEFFAACLANI